MNYITYIQKLNYLLFLAEKRKTGTPQEIAIRFDVSERTVRRMIDNLREQGHDIRYCRTARSYIVV